MILHTSSYIPGGMGIFRSTQGVCGTTGMITGGKKSSRNRPRSESFQAKPKFCKHMKWCIRSRSAGQRKSLLCTLSIISRLSAVYRPIGANGGGFGESDGILARGSPIIFRSMRNRSGRIVATGRILFATVLYFRFVANTDAGGEGSFGQGLVCCE